MVDRNETGRDSSITVNGNRIPATSKSFSNDTQRAASKFDDNYFEDSATTGQELSGELEAEGSNEELEQQLFRPNGRAREGIVVHIRGEENGHRFSGVVPSLDREYENDGKTVTSVSFEADRYRRT